MFTEKRFIFGADGFDAHSFLDADPEGLPQATDPEEAELTDNFRILAEADAEAAGEAAASSPVDQAWENYTSLDEDVRDRIVDHLDRLSPEEGELISDDWNAKDEYGQRLNSHDRVFELMEFQHEYNQMFGENILVDGDVGPQVERAIAAVQQFIRQEERALPREERLALARERVSTLSREDRERAMEAALEGSALQALIGDTDQYVASQLDEEYGEEAEVTAKAAPETDEVPLTSRGVLPFLFNPDGTPREDIFGDLPEYSIDPSEQAVLGSDEASDEDAS